LEVDVIRSFDGKTPVIDETAFVSEAAYVVGDVAIGEGSGVFPGAVIRGDFADIRIGRNTMIEDNSVVHSGDPLEIGDNVIVGHSVVVHCRKVGHGCLIGSNATLLDDAEIGNNCVIGAGCVVSRGMVVPDGSLVVGVPGEIKRRLEQRVAGKAKSGGSRSYHDLVRLYKQEGL